jgi:hypothetical protein
MEHAKKTVDEKIVKPESPRAMPSAVPPRTGVEIVSSEVRKGLNYYSVRDLRNTRVVHNVTLASARSLWQYAIEQAEKNPCTVDQVQWRGDMGLWKSYKRGGKVRYDLVQRTGDQLTVYYGVTEDGVHGAWRAFFEVESAVEPEASENDVHLEAATASEIAVDDETTEATLANENTVEEHEEELLHPRISVTEEGDVIELAPVSVFAEPESISEEPVSESSETVFDFEPIPESEAELEIEDELPEPSTTQPVKPMVTEKKPDEPVQPSTPKTRAQTWREKLNQAMAEANALRSPGEAHEGSVTLPELEEAKKVEEEIADVDTASGEGQTGDGATKPDAI